MSGHRQAAVALHSVGRHDQELILAELPTADQQILRTYLRELEDLGFSHDAADSIAPVAASEGESDRRRLAMAAPAAVVELLANEPATLIAQVLSIDAWPWAAALLDQLPPARRALVQTALEGYVVPAPARSACLLDELNGRLALRGAAAPAAHPAMLWKTFLSRVSAWTR